MKTQAALIAADPVYLTWLKETLGSGVDLHWLRPDDAAEPVASQLARLEDIEIAFIEAEPARERTRLLESLTDQQPDLLLIAVGADSPTDAVIDAMRAGARDFFVMGRDDRQLPERLRKLMRKSSGTRSGGERQGQLISVHSATGGASLAWTAEHLALAMLEHCGPGERVLLLDAGVPHGASLVFLNLAQTYSLLDAVQDVHRCDQTLIDTAFVRHASGLFVLSLPEDMVEPAQLDDDELLALLDVLARHFHRIVFCTGANLGVETVAGVLNRAQASLLLTDGSILSSRANKHMLKALRLEDCSFERMGLVVDGEGLVRGLDAASLAQLIELPLWADMPVHYANRLRAMNSGEPLYKVAPKDPYCRVVQDLASRLARGDIRQLAQPQESPGMLRRLFGT